MLSEECLQDGGPSEAPESTDVTSKKKKSFHPLRSLKRFFGHGGNSRRRSNNDDIAENSTVLLKARSTTDVIVSAEATEESECTFQRASKQISLSADSIFSTERTCDSNLPVSAISSEALLHNENCGVNSLLQRKDDDEGLPQSPCNLTTTAELFIENGLKEDQSEKWPSFDSGHSLLSVDSNENEAEEDFFKEKWATSKSISVPGNETSATDSSLREDLDLNLVMRHPSLISSAVIHRLAVRPKGKRVLSTYQQRHAATSMKLAVSGKSLPLVKEESGTSTKAPDADTLGISESHETFSSKGNSLDAVRSSENEASIRISCATEIPEKSDAWFTHEKSVDTSSTKKVNIIHSFEKVGITRSKETDEVTKGVERSVRKKSRENVASMKSAEKLAETVVITKSSEDVGQGENAVLQKEDLKKEMMSSRAEPTAAENAEESSKPVTDRTESEMSLSQVPAKQTIVPRSVVVVRQKPPRAVAPSAQEIQEMAARRQTLAFSGESGSGAEKPVSKRSSMVIPDRPLIPVEAGNTELAEMFSKFQRRSSQKKQNEVEDSKPVEDDNNNGRSNENVSQTATNSKPVFAQTASKEQVPLAKVMSGVKRSRKLVEVSPQGTGGSPVGLSSTNPQIRMTNSVKSAEKKVEKSPESSERKTSRGSEKKPEKITEKNLEKTTERNTEKTTEKSTEKTPEKNTEKTTEKNKEKTIEKTTEKNTEKTTEKKKEKTIEKATEKNREKNTELKIEAADQKEAGAILNKSENVKKVSTPLSVSDEKTKAVKKSYSISYKMTKSPADKSQQGTVTSIKTRSASQSEPDEGAEIPTKTTFSQGSRRGSFTYTHQNDGRVKESPVPSSEVSSRTERRASTTSENIGRTTDVKYTPPSIATPTRPPSRPGMVVSSSGMVATGSRMVPLGSGTVPAETETVPSGGGAVPLGSGMAYTRAASTPDRSSTVPLGSRVVPRVIVGPGAVRSTGGATPKESAVPVAPQVIPTSDKSVKEAKVLTYASEKSSHQASSSKASETLPNRDASQLAPKAAPSIRPTGGQRIPAVKEGGNLVEWVGVARQKTKAWKEGKIDIAEKVESCN